jgi:hypothetical protein
MTDSSVTSNPKEIGDMTSKTQAYVDEHREDLEAELNLILANRGKTLEQLTKEDLDTLITKEEITWFHKRQEALHGAEALPLKTFGAKFRNIVADFEDDGYVSRLRRYKDKLFLYLLKPPLNTKVPPQVIGLQMQDGLEVLIQTNQDPKVVKDQFNTFQACASAVRKAERGHVHIEMGREGPKLIIEGEGKEKSRMLVIDNLKASIPLIERLIPKLERAGPRAGRCAEEGKKILARWERLKHGKQEVTDEELSWFRRHAVIDETVPSVTVTSKKREIVERACEIAEKMLGKPQPLGRERDHLN